MTGLEYMIGYLELRIAGYSPDEAKKIIEKVKVQMEADKQNA